MSKFQQYTQLRFDRHDVWQIAWSFSSVPAEFFRNFDPQRPVENYAYRTMEGRIKDEIFGNLGMGARMYSDWGLLWRKSRKFLQEALQHQGYSQPQLERYLLACDCFKEIYASQRPTGSRSLPAPIDKQFQDMADLYNRLLQPPAVAIATATRAMIEASLKECIRALRNYETRHLVSIDASSSGNEDSAPLSEMIPDPASESELEQLEMQELTKQLMAVLPEFLAQIPRETDNHLLLTCGFDLDYRSIAPIFGVYYTTVGYRCNSATRQLLNQVAQWAQKQLDVTPDSEKLKEMHAALKQCLNQHYKDLIFQSVFENALKQLDRQRRNMLHLSYFRQVKEAAIARQLQLCELEVSNGLVTGSQDLAAAISNWIQNRLNIPPDSDLLNPLANGIATLVQRLVANYPESEFQ